MSACYPEVLVPISDALIVLSCYFEGVRCKQSRLTFCDIELPEGQVTGLFTFTHYLHITTELPLGTILLKPSHLGESTYKGLHILV